MVEELSGPDRYYFSQTRTRQLGGRVPSHEPMNQDFPLVPCPAMTRRLCPPLSLPPATAKHANRLRHPAPLLVVVVARPARRSVGARETVAFVPCFARPSARRGVRKLMSRPTDLATVVSSAYAGARAGGRGRARGGVLHGHGDEKSSTDRRSPAPSPYVHGPLACCVWSGAWAYASSSSWPSASSCSCFVLAVTDVVEAVLSMELHVRTRGWGVPRGAS